MKLWQQSCKLIKAETLPLDDETMRILLSEIPRWSVKGNMLIREFRFRDFREAMDFVNNTADIANAENHHPYIEISYSEVRLTLTTHKIKNLSLNDFIIAAKIDRIIDR